ncbi:MAG: glutathionylspermidine synthase family protein [Treponema sp.]|nr:glutathionylspermidine synthase family protein [Treponema sp.]
MSASLRLSAINPDKYCEYRTDLIFNAYKWDPQVADQNTIAKHAIVIKEETAQKLGQWAEQMSKETVLMEEALIHNLPLAKKLGFLPQIIKELPRLSDYKAEQNVRLMRFDFHPVTDGWAVSEVNSDVPGGLAEASLWPKIAGKYINEDRGVYTAFAENVDKLLLEAFKKKIKNDGTIAFVHATSYSDDRQVMQFLGDCFSQNGLQVIYAAPDLIKWKNKKAFCIINKKECAVDGIVRFFPLEWLVNLSKNSNWQGYYDTVTPSCNHPAAIFAQSKRLPLIWDSLGIDIPFWKKFLPVTFDPKSKSITSAIDDDWIHKPAFGRVGEGISIKEAITKKEMDKIKKAVKKYPGDWIIQKRFNSQPVLADDGSEYHICIGAFTVQNKCAGFYGRISSYPRIDSKAMDIPILIEKEN